MLSFYQHILAYGTKSEIEILYKLVDPFKAVKNVLWTLELDEHHMYGLLCFGIWKGKVCDFK
jgi:hypothetical protein